MPESGRWLVWGSSGHGKVLADAIGLCGGSIELLVDNDPDARACVTGARLLRGEAGLKEWLAQAPPGTAGAMCAAVAIGGARGADRRAIAALLRECGFSVEPVIHPSAAVARSAAIAYGCHVLANAVVAADARIGPMTIVNNGSIVDHECELGAGVHVAPGATLCGCVTVEDDAMVGAGATILPRLRIGRGAVVGAGATVTKNVPPGKTVAGCPARVTGDQR